MTSGTTSSKILCSNLIQILLRHVVGVNSMAANFVYIWVAPILVLKWMMTKKQMASRILPIRYEDLMMEKEKMWNETILPFCGLRMRGTGQKSASTGERR